MTDGLTDRLTEFVYQYRSLHSYVMRDKSNNTGYESRGKIRNVYCSGLQSMRFRVVDWQRNPVVALSAGQWDKCVIIRSWGDESRRCGQTYEDLSRELTAVTGSVTVNGRRRVIINRIHSSSHRHHSIALHRCCSELHDIDLCGGVNGLLLRR